MIPANEKNIGQALVQARLMTADELNRAIENVEKKRSPGLIIQLIENDFLKFGIFQKFLFQNYKIRTTILNKNEIPQNMVTLIGLDKLKEKMIMPVMAKTVGGSKKLALGMVNPLDDKTIAEIQKITAHDVTAVLISLSDFTEALSGLTGFRQKMELTPVMSYEDQLDMKKQTDKSAEKSQSFEVIKLDESKTEEARFLGPQIKKYREEIASKLGLDEKDYAQLKQDSYSRADLSSALKNVKKSILEKIYDESDAKARLEALSNALIAKGVLNKHDILVSAAISRIFKEETTT